MEKTRILSLDIGLKRTGVAVSDPGQTMALPRTHFEATGKREWLEKVAEILNEDEEIGQILVGIPLNHHGEEGEDAKTIRKYVALLQERFTLPVLEWDERFTTVQAERSLISADISRKKRKGIVDQVAATIILQNYLDSLAYKRNEYPQ